MTSDPIKAYLAGGPLTITIRSLRAQNGGSEVLVGIVLESGEHREQKNLLLTVEQYREWKLSKGEITEATYEELEEASNLCRAIRSGESLLSYGSNSVQMLVRKLTRRGYSREISERAASRLTEMGLINEGADLRREVEKCLRKLWGAKRISAHLWSRGFGTEAMALLPSLLAEADFSANCAALIRKHYGGLPTDPDEERRMLASLSRYGYTLSEIKEAKKRLKSEQ